MGSATSVVGSLSNELAGFFKGSSEKLISAAKVLTVGDLDCMHVCSGTTADYPVYLPKPADCAGHYIGFRMDPGLTKLVTLDAGQSDNTKTGTVTTRNDTEITSGYVCQSTSSYTGYSFSSVDNESSYHVGDRLVYSWDNVINKTDYVTAISPVTMANKINNGYYNFAYVKSLRSTGIVGVNTAFLTDLTVGGLMWINGESRTVGWIGDDTHCGVDTPFPAGSGLTYSAAGTPYTIDGSQKRVMWANEVAILYSDGYKWTKIAGKSIPMSAGIGMNANQTFANNTVTKILFDVSFSLNGPAAQQEISSNRLRILRSGIYSVHVQYQWYWANSPSTTTNIWVKKNAAGTVVAQSGYSVYANNSAVPEVTNPSVELVAGDYLTGHAAYYTSSLSPTIYGNSSSGPTTYMSITEIPTW